MPDKPGKTEKKPVSVHTGKVEDAHNPMTWCDFKTAALYVADHWPKVHGVGFVLTGEDYVGGDLDNCIDAEGNIAEWAQEILAEVNTYAEISFSGTGIRFIAKGRIPVDGRRNPSIELYQNRRFLTFTGRHLAGYPTTIEDRTQEIEALYLRIFGKAEEVKPQATKPAEPLTVDDSKLLEIAFQSAKGADILALWNGRITHGNGKPDHSAADQALANHLVYWCQGDLTRADRLFRQSGLYRPKWDERRGKGTYGQMTLEKAQKTIPAFYDPSYRSNGNGTNGNHAPREVHTLFVEQPFPTWEDLPPVEPPTVPLNGDNGKSDKKVKQLKSEALIEALQRLGLSFRLNLLEDNVEVDGQRLDDITLSQINLRLVDLGFSRADIADAVNVLAGRNTYHPVKDYLLGLKWDGRKHLYDMLTCFTGNGATVKYKDREEPLHAVLIYRWLLGCVARALDGDKENAFKHQTPMLVIIGRQGLGKSSWVRWLVSGIGYQFHRESMVSPHNIDDQRSMITKWIWEVSELSSSLRRSDRDSLKSFITQEWHTYRKPYGKHPITKPTLCNLVGTLNPENGFLDDPTGHRRFLPVEIKRIDHRYNEIDVNQLWAHVVHLYQSGQSPELLQTERAALESVYERNRVEDPLETYVNMYFEVEPGNQDLRCHTAAIIDRLRAFGVSLPPDNKVAGRKLNDVLAPMGLERSPTVFRVDGIPGRGWLGIAPNGRTAGGASTRSSASGFDVTDKDD